MIKSIMSGFLAFVASAMLVACGGGGNNPISTTITMTAKAATVATPSNSTVSAMTNQEVGRFALSSDGDARITKLVATNDGTAGLSSLVDPSSVELWDADTNKKVSAQVVVTGNVVSFDSMSQDMKKDFTSNFKVILTSVKNIDGVYGKTMRFTLTSFTAVSVVSGLTTGVIGAPLAMKEYTIGMIPPTVLVSGYSPLNQNSPVAKVRVTNVDSASGFAVSSVTLKLTFRSSVSTGLKFSSTVCLRELGSIAHCGSFGTTTGAYLIDESGGVITFIMKDLNLATLTKNGGYVEFDVYLENSPLWVAGDTFNVTVNSATTSNGGALSTYSYVGVTGASATATK